MTNCLKKAFEKAAEDNYWGDTESVSGPGSNLIQTRVISKKIPELLEKYYIKKMLDAPCGDLFWMKEILPGIVDKGIEYNGADIVPSLIEKHKKIFNFPNVKFYNLDLTKSKLPQVDLIFTRDCFIHLSYNNIFKVIKNYKRSGAQYLLVSTYTNPSRKNFDVDKFYLYGRMLNMQKFPFYFKHPIELIVEGCTEGNGEFADKSLGLWNLSNLILWKLHIYIIISFVHTLCLKMGRKVKHYWEKL